MTAGLPNTCRTNFVHGKRQYALCHLVPSSPVIIHHRENEVPIMARKFSKSLFIIFVLTLFCLPLIYANESGYSNEEVDDPVDFNLNGISDNYQPHIIKGVQIFDVLAHIGIEKVSSFASEIEALEVIDPDTISDTAIRPEDLISDFISYLFHVNQPGDTAKLNIYFSRELFPSDTFFKHDTINDWCDYSENTKVSGGLRDATKTIGISLTFNFTW
jgi:hypothetical protein